MKKFQYEINLFLVLSRMHLKASDYRSLLGVCWSFINPILSFVILYFIFVSRFGHHIPHFQLKLFVGIICLRFFTSVVTTTMGALRQYHATTINTTAPIEVLMLAPLSLPTLKFVVEMLLCIILTIYFGLASFLNLLCIIPVMVIFFFLAVGTGLLLCVLRFFASDVQELWTTLSPMLLFTTPVFYSLDMLSSWASTIIYWFNPATPFVLIIQTLLTNNVVPFFSISTSLLAVGYAFGFCLIGYSLFKKLEKKIIEIL